MVDAIVREASRRQGVSRVEPPRRYPAETVGLAAGNLMVVVRYAPYLAGRQVDAIETPKRQ